jgi:hypothetical protein
MYMIAVHFDKAFAEQVLDAVETGKPIPLPKGGQWTGNHMLTLAGILYAAVYSQGPHSHQIAGIDAALLEMHAEKQEAVGDTLSRDIHDGIEFLSMLTFKVMDDEYDAEFEPEMTAVVHETEDGEKKVRPHEGWKKH